MDREFATSARLRDDMISRVREVTGRNWMDQIREIRRQAYACHAAYEAGQTGAALTADDVVAVEEALQARAQRMDDNRRGHQYRASMAGRAAAFVEDLARVIEAGPLEPEPVETDQVEAAALPPTSVPIIPRTPTKPRRIIPAAEAVLRAARIERRRCIAKLGRIPARIAQAYTPGQQAVMSVIIREVVLYGACTLAVDSIAAFARVSRRVVQSARRIAQQRGHLAVQEQVRAPNVITILDLVLAKYVGKLTNQESKKSPAKQNLTHPTKGANARAQAWISPSEAPPEPAPVEAVPTPVPEPVPVHASPEAAVEACEPAPVVEAVKPAPPPERKPDAFDRILSRIGLSPRGFQPVAEHGTG